MSFYEKEAKIWAPKKPSTLCPDKGSLLPFLNLVTYTVPNQYQKHSFSEKETEAVKGEWGLRKREKKDTGTMNCEWGNFCYVQKVLFSELSLLAFSGFLCVSLSKTPERQRFAWIEMAPPFHINLFSILVISKQPS